MNAPANRSGAVRNLLRSVTSRLNRERHAPVFDRFVRRGGGLLVLTALSVFAGWNLPRLPFPDDSSPYPAERCLRVVAVVRLATGRPEVPGPFLLLQTAWMQPASRQGSPSRVFDCESSERMLPLPPVHNRVFQRRGAAFELLPAPDVERVLDRLFELPPELEPRPTAPSSHPSPEAT